MVGTTSGLRAPFLDGEKPGDIALQTKSSTRIASGELQHKSLAQRVAGLHWPHPTGAALLLTGMAGCACLADHARGSKGELPAELGVSLSADSSGELDELGSVTIILSMVGALLLNALACQFIFEKFLARAATQVVRNLLLKCSDFRVELGRMRVWVFPGRVEIRNCFVRNPHGYQCNTLLHLRTIIVDFNLARCFRQLINGVPLEVCSVHLKGVEVTLEKGGVSGAQSNLQEAAMQFEGGAKDAGVKPKLLIRKVSITDLVLSKVGGPSRTTVANIECADLSKEEGVGTVHQAIAASLKMLEKRVAVS